MDIMYKVETKNYAIYNGDCMDVMTALPDDSIHLSVYSPPFGGLYNYSSDVRDLSNCATYDDFFDHYRFVVKEISRITMPGRISAVHCTDMIAGSSGNSDHLIDFPGDIVRLHKELGFHYICRHTVWREPLWVRLKTMNKSLAHRTICEDGTKGGVAKADYVLIFRKCGENPVPVVHETGLEHYAGEEPMPADILRYKNWTGKQTENKFSQWIWRHYASCIWDDIRMNRVLPFKDCKDVDDEKHVHPLMLDITDRVVSLRTNPGETVLTPFMGVGSEVYAAVALGRRGIGIELKKSYYRQACANMEVCEPGIYSEAKAKQTLLFD